MTDTPRDLFDVYRQLMDDDQGDEHQAYGMITRIDSDFLAEIITGKKDIGEVETAIELLQAQEEYFHHAITDNAVTALFAASREPGHIGEIARHALKIIIPVRAARHGAPTADR